MKSRTTIPVGAAGQSSWWHKSQILKNYSIGFRRLDSWVVEGIVRSVKLDPRKQGRRLYCASDIDAALLALSEGRDLKRMAGRRAAA